MACIHLYLSRSLSSSISLCF
uniref:Uncharacterized protein n=1 Tax=Anguilla anguilla TaxID=7936 RepID=A0A0E9QRG3_ANGAN